MFIKGVYYEEIEKPNPASKFKKDKPAKTTSTETVITGMNFDALNEVSLTFDPSPSTTTKTTRKKKTTDTNPNNNIIPAEKDTKYSQNEPYMNMYQETNNLLKTAITQLDIGLGEMQNDMTALRNNKTLRNKYQSMSMIQKNMGDFLGNKINAIKELNNVITKCNDMEFKRAKELKEIQNQDDDARIMDLYNAMISMPVGGQSGSMANGFSSPLGPTTFDMTYAANPNSNMPNIITSVDVNGDAGYEAYLQNKTPNQNMMSLSNNPNVQQVVIHNRNTGQSYFEIMDMSTMQPVPNTDRYDTSFLADTHLDLVNNIATNVNIGESYPIIQIGSDPILNEY